MTNNWFDEVAHRLKADDRAKELFGKSIRELEIDAARACIEAGLELIAQGRVGYGVSRIREADAKLQELQK